MAIQIIVNDAARDADDLKVTDLSDSTIDNDASKLTLLGGHRHLTHTSSTTTDRRYVYTSSGASLKADTVIVTRADRFAGIDMEFYAWDSYASTKTKILDAGTSPSLVGLNSQDYIGSFSEVSGKEGLGMDLVGTLTKKVNSLYFGSAISLDSLAVFNPVSIIPADESDYVKCGPWFYRLEELLEIKFECVPDSTAQLLREAYNANKRPIFLYDSLAEYLPGYLWHCILIDIRIDRVFDDQNSIKIELGRIKEFPQSD